METVKPVIAIAPAGEVAKVKTREIESRVNKFTLPVMGLEFRRTFELNTIFTRTAEAIATILNERIKTAAVGKIADLGPLDMCGLFKAYITVKENEDSEKEGNVNIVFELAENPPMNEAELAKFFRPHQGKNEHDVIMKIVPEAPEAGSPPEKVLEYTRMMNSLMAVDRAARASLSERHNFTTSRELIITTTFLVYLYETIWMMIEDLNNSESRGRHMNLMDTMEVYVTKRGSNKINVKIAPGEGCKLLIKYDAFTEFGR